MASGGEPDFASILAALEAELGNAVPELNVSAPPAPAEDYGEFIAPQGGPSAPAAGAAEEAAFDAFEEPSAGVAPQESPSAPTAEEDAFGAFEEPPVTAPAEVAPAPPAAGAAAAFGAFEEPPAASPPQLAVLARVDVESDPFGTSAAAPPPAAPAPFFSVDFDATEGGAVGALFPGAGGAASSPPPPPRTRLAPLPPAAPLAPPPPPLAAALRALHEVLASAPFTNAVVAAWEGGAAWRACGGVGHAPPPHARFSADDLAALARALGALGASAAAEAEDGGDGGAPPPPPQQLRCAELEGGSWSAAQRCAFATAREAALLRELAKEALAHCHDTSAPAAPAAPAETMWARMAAARVAVPAAPAAAPLPPPSDEPGARAPLRAAEPSALRANVMPRPFAAARRRVATSAKQAPAQPAPARALGELVAAQLRRVEEALPVFPY